MMKKKEYVKPESMVIPVECVFICSVSTTSGGPSTHKDGDEDDEGPKEEGEEGNRPSKNFIFSDDDDHFEYQDALFGNF